MKSTSDGVKAKAAKATNKAEASPSLGEMLMEAGVSVPPVLPGEGDPNCAKCAIAASIKRKFMAMVFTLCILGFLFMPPFGLGIGAFAQNVDAPEAADTARVVARALEVNSTTSAADSACTMLSGSIYPAPSAVSVTTTVDAATATATATSNVSVTPISTEASTSDSSCTAPVTVTVTITTQATADAITGTAGASGAPPQSSESTDSTSTTFSTVTETSTLTSTATLSQTSTTTSTASETPFSATTTNSTGSTTTTTTVTTSSLSLLHSLGTGTGVYVTGTGTGTGTVVVGTIGTASFTIHPSANSSFTYSLPSVSPSHPLTTVISSSASAIGARGHGGGGSGSGRDQRGGKSGFYCVVMAVVACGFALVV